jgi:2-polyprenyl-6-methoxyphenol hydroxylase-like FAD-dependent oxidoreductase
MARETFGEDALVDEDEEITLLACRRLTFDWVLRRYVDTLDGIELRSGLKVEALDGHRDESGRMRVTGVRLDASSGGETIRADLVIDAMGRNSRLKRWLDELGTDPMREESESCGIFYCSRFYRILPEAKRPPAGGPIAGDLGFMKYAVFQGDSDIFSVTLAASPDDDALRRVRDPEIFHAVAARLPNARAWLDPAVSEPITDVSVYANLKNTRRFFVDEGEPRALGLYPIGDSLLHANPIAGRGCTIGWVSAFLLADAWNEAEGDLLGFARTVDAGLEREIVPAWKALRDQDRATAEMSAEESEGDDPFAFQRDDGTIDPKKYMRSLLRDGLMPALEQDIVVLRAAMRVFNLLSAPTDLMKDPDLFARVLAVWNARESRERSGGGPDRTEIAALCERAA